MFCVFAVNFLSAIWFAIRIWRHQRVWFAKSVGFMTIFIGLIVAFTTPLVGICISALVAPIFTAQVCYKNWHRSQLRIQQVRYLVDSVILEMRAGHSFRTALGKVVVLLQDEAFKERLQIWLATSHAPLSSEADSSWWSLVAPELFLIDQHAHQALARLQQWRLRLKLESDFRRRFGQVATQVRLQAVVVAVLYLAIFAFHLWRGGGAEHRMLLIISFTLFISGLCLIFRLGRRVKWTF